MIIANYMFLFHKVIFHHIGISKSQFFKQVNILALEIGPAWRLI